MFKPQAVLSRSEEERVEKLGAYFRDFLQSWFAGIVVGVRYSPGVMRELALAMLQYGAIALIASSDAAMKEPDEETTERALRAAQQAFEVLEREVVS